jgi:hypothetical protein
MDDADRDAELRDRARRIREQAQKLAARAAAMPAGPMQEMLARQAEILHAGAGELDAQALALAPAQGTA